MRKKSVFAFEFLLKLAWNRQGSQLRHDWGEPRIRKNSQNLFAEQQKKSHKQSRLVWSQLGFEKVRHNLRPKAYLKGHWAIAGAGQLRPKYRMDPDKQAVTAELHDSWAWRGPVLVFPKIAVLRWGLNLESEVLPIVFLYAFDNFRDSINLTGEIFVKGKPTHERPVFSGRKGNRVFEDSRPLFQYLSAETLEENLWIVTREV